MTEYRRQSNRVPGIGIIVSVLLHSVVFGTLIFLAAREGMLGRELRKMAVTLVPRPKQAEPKPAERPTVPAVPQIAPTQPPKADPVVQPPLAQERIEVKVTSPNLKPSLSPSRLTAPPPMTIPALEFGGANIVETASDPVVLYRGYVEYTFRANWIRPANVRDQTFVAEIEVTIDPSGAISATDWKKGSGNRPWDAAVREAVAKTKTIDRRPPEGFPDKMLVRFDVQPQTGAWNQ